MMIFERLRLDIVVVGGVGMGGRLDATNAIPDETAATRSLTHGRSTRFGKFVCWGSCYKS